MPMPAKGARIILRRRAGRPDVWIIKDTAVEISTRTGHRGEAEKRLADYIAAKERRKGPAHPTIMTCAEVLSAYGTEHAPSVARPDRIGYAIAALLPYFGDMPASEVKGETCRAFAKSRTRTVAGKTIPIKPATIRRELSTLQAALNFCHREGYITRAPVVTLPATPETHQRALTRDEVAKLLWVAHRRNQRHVMHFILLSIYTGTRKAAALNIRLRGPSPNSGWCDLKDEILYRRGHAEVATKKRRTPVRIPRQLLGHLRRWDRMGHRWAVEYERGRVLELRTAWGKIVDEADLGWRPTPHTLKHTAITWAIQGGATLEDAVAFFATSRETIERTYWHLSPNFQSGAIAAIERQR